MNPDHRFQIEGRLDRELTADELVEVGSFDELSKPQLAVVAKLAEREGVTPGLYLRAIVRGADHVDVRDFVLNLDAFVAAKYPPDPSARRLRMEPLYEAELGRPLTADERVPAKSLQALSAAHLAVARALSIKDVITGLTYLGDIVPGAHSYDRETLAERLRAQAAEGSQGA
jgi:hypothetical protein